MLSSLLGRRNSDDRADGSGMQMHATKSTRAVRSTSANEHEARQTESQQHRKSSRAATSSSPSDCASPSSHSDSVTATPVTDSGLSSSSPPSARGPGRATRERNNDAEAINHISTSNNMSVNERSRGRSVHVQPEPSTMSSYIAHDSSPRKHGHGQLYMDDGRIPVPTPTQHRDHQRDSAQPSPCGSEPESPQPLLPFRHKASMQHHSYTGNNSRRPSRGEEEDTIDPECGRPSPSLSSYASPSHAGAKLLESGGQAKYPSPWRRFKAWIRMLPLRYGWCRIIAAVLFGALFMFLLGHYMTHVVEQVQDMHLSDALGGGAVTVFNRDGHDANSNAASTPTTPDLKSEAEAMQKEVRQMIAELEKIAASTRAANPNHQPEQSAETQLPPAASESDASAAVVAGDRTNQPNEVESIPQLNAQIFTPDKQGQEQETTDTQPTYTPDHDAQQQAILDVADPSIVQEGAATHPETVSAAESMDSTTVTDAGSEAAAPSNHDQSLGQQHSETSSTDQQTEIEALLREAEATPIASVDTTTESQSTVTPSSPDTTSLPLAAAAVDTATTHAQSEAGRAAAAHLAKSKEELERQKSAELAILRKEKLAQEPSFILSQSQLAAFRARSEAVANTPLPTSYPPFTPEPFLTPSNPYIFGDDVVVIVPTKHIRHDLVASIQQRWGTLVKHLWIFSDKPDQKNRIPLQRPLLQRPHDNWTPVDLRYHSFRVPIILKELFERAEAMKDHSQQQPQPQQTPPKFYLWIEDVSFPLLDQIRVKLDAYRASHGGAYPMFAGGEMHRVKLWQSYWSEQQTRAWELFHTEKLPLAPGWLFGFSPELLEYVSEFIMDSTRCPTLFGDDFELAALIQCAGGPVWEKMEYGMFNLVKQSPEAAGMLGVPHPNDEGRRVGHKADLDEWRRADGYHGVKRVDMLQMCMEEYYDKAEIKKPEQITETNEIAARS